MTTETLKLFQSVLNSYKSMNMPSGWFVDVGSEFNNINETLIGFHQLSKFKISTILK